MIFLKQVLSAVAAVALAILLAADAAHAQPAVGPSPIAGQTLFLFSFIGSGPSTVMCNEETGDCTSSFTGIANGSAIGLKAALSSSFSWNVAEGIVSGNDICYVAAGTGTVVTKSKGELDFTQTGLLCGPLDGFSPAAFNGSFAVVSGTGKFAASVGGGGATASSDSSGFVLLFAEGSLTWKGQAPPAG